MDIVYTVLERRPGHPSRSRGESAEITAALWAHAAEHDRLEHVAARCESNRVDLLFYLATVDIAARAATGPEDRAFALLRRCYEASPLLTRRYLPPVPAGGADIAG
ncbi:hypothetical protein GCM10009665_69630 [Kitasatospora nipponensis]|uniref:Uncharacterized protein n=1 Tax=Kitasatospora nipponensis TaxID=258049 RepID=A0ABN1X0W7_9ACTN